MKIVITKEDVDNSESFESTTGCALAKVMQRELKDPDIAVGYFTINDKRGRLGEINPRFSIQEYEALKKGEIQEFVTEYTPI